MTILTRDLFATDPHHLDLLNDGVAAVADVKTAEQEHTLRFELQTFVCEGEYERGLRVILSSFLNNINKPAQPAVWVSGFYGTGKSHLVKMLQHLWADYRFSDGATARGLVKLPNSIRDLLVELSAEGKRASGLVAVGDKLSPSSDSLRLRVLQLVLRGLKLPEQYPAARLVLWLREQGLDAQVRSAVEQAGYDWDKELRNMFVSHHLAQAILSAHPKLAKDEPALRALLREQFPNKVEITDDELHDTMRDALAPQGRFPCTLIVLDELQQHIGNESDRAYGVQLLAETLSKRFGSKLMFVGTGQSALNDAPQLQKLMARFTVRVHLSDKDVEQVTRKVILAKKPQHEPQIEALLTKYSGEVSRQLAGTKLGATAEDDQVKVADFPILPVRRRLWERVLREADPSGLSGQLRNQLSITLQAIKALADTPLGCVAPADFIYDQIASTMIQTGAMLPEAHAIVKKQDDGSAEGSLRARVCALAYLISRLPRDGSDTGVRATPEALADLLFDDLTAGSADLRGRMPDILKSLVEDGDVMQVEDEYRLQTQESKAWNAQLRQSFSRYLSDDNRIAEERAQAIQAACGDELKPLKLRQGNVNESRKWRLIYGEEAPKVAPGEIAVWVRDGWNTNELSVKTEAINAGTDSATVFVFLPKLEADALRRAIASQLAARETLELRGNPSSPAGLEASKAIETQAAGAKARIDQITREILARARVFQGGGGEVTSVSTMLLDMTREAANNSLLRLFPRFGDADDARWPKVIDRARNGDGDPLSALQHKDDAAKQPVCREVLGALAGGQKGRDVRNRFAAPPYGWPQDAIDGALLALVAAKVARAVISGTAVDAKALDQTKIGVAEFRPETVTLTAAQLIKVRRLYQDVGIPVKAGEEAAQAPAYLAALEQLARAAGGDPPAPEPPALGQIEALRRASGNEQLLALATDAEALVEACKRWREAGDLIKQRLPAWHALQDLLGHASALPAAADVTTQVEAIRAQRALLRNPDPVPPLETALTTAVREALQRARSAYAERFNALRIDLTQSAAWLELDADQQNAILIERGLAEVPPIHVANEDELLNSLRKTPLREWATQTDALTQRFENARMDAARLRMPEAARVKLPGATLRNVAEADAWLAQVRERILRELGQGKSIIV